MIQLTKPKTIPIGTGKLKAHLLSSGNIQKLTYESKMINQLYSSNLDQQIANLYLRIRLDNQYLTTPLLGSHSPSKIFYQSGSITYEGEFSGITYRVKYQLMEHTWFYVVDFLNNGKVALPYDLFYVQDIGIKDEGGVRSGEAYNSQYIDHKVFSSTSGYVVCSLQNQGNKEYLQIGSLTGADYYATDGFQFYGLNYKLDNQPEALKKQCLPNEIYQYEFAMASLQTQEETLMQGKSNQHVFYGHYVNDHPEVITSLEYQDEIRTLFGLLPKETDELGQECRFSTEFQASEPYYSPELTEAEIERFYPSRIQEEHHQEKLLSFFLSQSEHVILQAKECLVERGHGHIILNGDNLFVKDQVFASTNYMFGVFSSQVVVGNTTFNRFLTTSRNALNIAKTSGMRIYVKLDGKYRMLTMPASYELGFNYSRWLYKIQDDYLQITSYMAYQGATLILEVKSLANKDYDLLVQTQVAMGIDEYSNHFQMELDASSGCFRLDDHTFTHSHYPNLNYRMDVDAPRIKFQNEEWVFHAKDEQEGLVLIEMGGASMTLTISAALEQKAKSSDAEFSLEKQRFIEYYKDTINDFHLDIGAPNPRRAELDKLNLIAYWYTHNALIHYASPHGLEQSGGAAWGTRDVCQGPFEYFLAVGKTDVLKAMLRVVFSHQYEETGSWPQWFMFDRYYKVQSHESHGDIIVWPLRSLANYLLATGDCEFLNETIGYTSIQSYEYTEPNESLYHHVQKEVDYIMSHMIPGTYLSIYGDGDWDDTLQPANPELRSTMVSGWTTALTYEAFSLLSESLAEFDPEYSHELQIVAEKIKLDYEKYVIKDQVPAGFLHFGEDGIRYMIHPLDEVTHMKYRLLPMTRGMIASLFDVDESQQVYKIIKEKLYHPDGVRLMNRTVPYQGGKNTFFKRAETAANFGREIGLQYVHAHIRYIEAMAKIGAKNDAWKGLMQVNPIQIQTEVPNALFRQSNTYFSSSDAHFLNRYQAMEEYDRIHTGSIGVKAGWRIYSSGPGIYIHQLIANVLGVRRSKNGLIIDPQIPSDFDGLTFRFTDRKNPLFLKYHIQGAGNQIEKITLNGQEIPKVVLPNRYRQGGWLVPNTIFDHIKESAFLLEVFINE